MSSSTSWELKVGHECKSRGSGVDHGVDGPSAGPTLNALYKVHTVGVRGLLPEMHEVTRSVMHRPVISEAAESERLVDLESPRVSRSESSASALRTME